jgi:hypothetical protein
VNLLAPALLAEMFLQIAVAAMVQFHCVASRLRQEYRRLQKIYGFFSSPKLGEEFACGEAIDNSDADPHLHSYTLPADSLCARRRNRVEVHTVQLLQ